MKQQIILIHSLHSNTVTNIKSNNFFNLKFRKSYLRHDEKMSKLKEIVKRKTGCKMDLYLDTWAEYNCWSRSDVFYLRHQYDIRKDEGESSLTVWKNLHYISTPCQIVNNLHENLTWYLTVRWKNLV